jgi:hypothetical protein
MFAAAMRHERSHHATKCDGTAPKHDAEDIFEDEDPFNPEADVIAYSEK